MTSMKPERLDALLAFKAIALSDALSGTEKRVASVILDSFNHKNTQCDPSLNRIAHLLRISRRTVIRAINRLERQRFMRKRRHGSYSHRNSYEPNWLLYREIENAWRSRKKTRHWKTMVAETSPYPSQSCHAGGDPAGTQTSLINQSNKPVAHNADRNGRGGTPEVGGQARRAEIRATVTHEGPERFRPSVRPHDAAVAAAERRWHGAVNDQFASSSDVYAQVIGAIDEAMQRAATEAEMNKHGAGIAYLLERLRAQGLEKPLRSV